MSVLAAAGIGAAVAGASTLLGLGQRSADLRRGREQQKYDRELQERIFEREDNAVQRRVTDLKAAGINPVLAAGQGAGTGIAYHSHEPKAERANIEGMENIGFLLTMAEQEARIRNIQAQTQQTRQQTKINMQQEKRNQEIHPRELTHRDLINAEQQWNINNHEIRQRAMVLENDRRLQELNKGEREMMALVYEIALKDVRLTRESREEFIDSLFSRTSLSPRGVLNIVSDWINAGGSQLADLAQRIDEHYGNDHRVIGRNNINRLQELFNSTDRR